jgi:hypothetical protein
MRSLPVKVVVCVILVIDLNAGGTINLASSLLGTSTMIHAYANHPDNPILHESENASSLKNTMYRLLTRIFIAYHAQLQLKT